MIHDFRSKKSNIFSIFLFKISSRKRNLNKKPLTPINAEIQDTIPEKTAQ